MIRKNDLPCFLIIIVRRGVALRGAFRAYCFFLFPASVAFIMLFSALRGMWMFEDAWGYANTPGNCRPCLSLKQHLIKTPCDEMWVWLGTLIGQEADIMYGVFCSNRTNDDLAVEWWGLCFFRQCVDTVLMTCFLGRSAFVFFVELQPA